MGTGFAKKKKEAKMMQNQFAKLQEEMLNLEVIGTAANGLVSITMNGDGDMKQVKIKPECVDPDDIEGLEMLIKTAYQDAQRQIKEKTPSIPGMF